MSLKSITPVRVMVDYLFENAKLNAYDAINPSIIVYKIIYLFIKFVNYCSS